MKHVLTTILLLCAAPASADDFEAAVTAWLATDEPAALPALSALAGAGDERAMILLGVIDRYGHARSDWFKGLNREEKRDLMRTPGTGGGKNWLTEVEGESGLARALLNEDNEFDMPAQATILLEAGEWALARPLLLGQFTIDPAKLVEISQIAAFPDDQKYLLWVAATPERNYSVPEGETPPATTATEKALQDEAASPAWAGSFQDRLHQSLLRADASTGDKPDLERLTNLALRAGEAQSATYPAFGTALTDSDNPSPERKAAYDAAAEILMTASETAPLRAICAAACPEAISDCTRTIYAGIGGAFGMSSIRMPPVTVIPADQYYASARFLDDLRSMAINPQDWNWSPPSYAACGLAALRPE